MDEVRLGEEWDAFQLIIHGGVNDLLNWEAEECLMHIFELILFVRHGVQTVGGMVDLICWDLQVEVVDYG